MKVGRYLALAVALVALVAVSGCFRQIVQTGRTPGPTVIHKPWTVTLFWGLIPAVPIDVSQQCRSGMATVQTQLSVPNLVASVLTIGIYSPRDVRITCATGTAVRPGHRELFAGRS